MARKPKPDEEPRHVLTVGELREFIRDLEPDVKFDFGCTMAGTPLDYYRLKWRDEKLLQIELNERGFGD